MADINRVEETKKHSRYLLIFLQRRRWHYKWHYKRHFKGQLFGNSEQLELAQLNL